MTDFVEYIPKRHGQRPPYWTPDTLTGLDNKNYVRQPNWAWIAGTTYYVPYEAVHGVPRPAPVEAGVEPVDPQDIIEALLAENARLRVEAQAQYHRGYYDGRTALQETER